MSVTSFSFLLFCAAVLAAYYIMPKRARWGVLLAGSLIFYFLSARPFTAIYLLVSVTTVYLGAMWFAKERKYGKLVLAAVLIVNFSMLASLKYLNLFLQPMQFLNDRLGFWRQIPVVKWAAALGMSFYTLQITGYLLDCYWKKIKPEKNPGKLLLFTCYFPQMISGPISRYEEIAPALFDGNRFEYGRFLRGIQRILWGFFQKLVISERLAVLVNTIYGDVNTYTGFYLWAAAAFFVLQLYTDFAGCMDIVLGVSECFGVILPENFKTPFFSRTIQEFWQRWHITLGTWLKDYIMFPILKSDTWYKMGNAIKKKWGKKWSRRIPTWLGLLVLWTAMGIWHGNGWKYVIGEGFWFWLLIVGSQLVQPVFEKFRNILNINGESLVWRLFQRIRTFICFSVGMIFFRAKDLGQAFLILKNAFTRWNTGILGRGVLELGLDKKDFIVVFAGLLVLFFVSVMKERGGVRDRLERQPLALRWTAFYILILSVVILGCYGVAYDPSNFIYAQF